MSWMDDDDNGSSLDLGINWDTVEDSLAPNFAALPDGWYTVRVSAPEITATKAGDMRQAKLRLDVIDGEHARRVIFARHTVSVADGASDGKRKSALIGRSQLKELFAAAGIGGSDLADLVGAEVEARIKLRPGSDRYPDPTNEVVGYRQRGGAAPRTAQAKSKPKFL